MILRELVELRADREATRALLEGINTRLETVESGVEGIDTRLAAVERGVEGIDTRLAAVERGVEGNSKRLAAVERGLGKTTELGVRAAIANKSNQGYPLPALFKDGEPWCRGCVG
jgi:hypothetical protein